jgi:hypothetical protein
MVEAGDAMNLGAGDVERLRHDRERFGRHEAELFLDSVQDGQQGAFERRKALDHAARPQRHVVGLAGRGHRKLLPIG